MPIRTPQLICRHGEVLADCSICHPIATPTLQTLSAQLDELLTTARPHLLRLAANNGITGDQAEDVAQETYIEAWRHLENLREPERFSAWLNGICRNVCQRHLRTRASRQTREISLSTSENETEVTAFDLPDPLSIDPDEDLVHQDMQTLLDRALGHLSDSTRELIELCYLAKQPQREVALRLGMSIGALELKLYRARRQLGQLLRGEMRTDAQEFGLLPNEDESMGWQETRYWCWLCGQQRLRVTFETMSSGGSNLRLRCPACSRQHDIDITNTGDAVVLNDPHTFRPALKRVLQIFGNFYDKAIHEQRCAICQASLQLHLIDGNTGNATIHPLKGLQRNFYIHVECPNCGLFLSDLAGILFYKSFIQKHYTY